MIKTKGKTKTSRRKTLPLLRARAGHKVRRDHRRARVKRERCTRRTGGGDKKEIRRASSAREILLTLSSKEEMSTKRGTDDST